MPVEDLGGLCYNTRVMATPLRFIVTAGPTREYIDPVRFISNPSTGRMGFAVARAAAKRGHAVTLVAGPVALRTPRGVARVDVVSAREMLAAVEKAVQSPAPTADSGASAPAAEPGPERTFLVATAAVADWRPKTQAAAKLKKTEMSGILELVRNPDILKTVSGCRKIGFAAETGADDIGEARRKCREKGAEMVVFNDVTAPGAGFGSRTNRVTFVHSGGGEERLELMGKDAIGARIVKFCEQCAARAERTP